MLPSDKPFARVQSQRLCASLNRLPIGKTVTYDDDLAVLAQRFGLDVSLDHKDATTFIEEAVLVYVLNLQKIKIGCGSSPHTHPSPSCRALQRKCYMNHPKVEG
jgi:hypothetical protein